MTYIVKGDTFPIRKYLNALGCVWHEYCRKWTTENKDLKKSLRMLGIDEKRISRIKLEKIIKKAVDKISE